MYLDYLERILMARVLMNVAQETPLDLAPNLSARLNNQVLLKREDMQSVFSFKLRGAYNKMAQLPPEQLCPRRNCVFGREPCPGSSFGGAAVGHHSDYRDADYHPPS